MAKAKKKSSRGRERTERGSPAGRIMRCATQQAKKTKRSAGAVKKAVKKVSRPASVSSAGLVDVRTRSEVVARSPSTLPGATPKPKKGLSDLRLLWP